jgi:hypothetical protein
MVLSSIVMAFLIPSDLLVSELFEEFSGIAS